MVTYRLHELRPTPAKDEEVSNKDPAIVVKMEPVWDEEEEEMSTLFEDSSYSDTQDSEPSTSAWTMVVNVKREPVETE